MDEFRGMRLVRKDGDKNFVVNIKVNFDKTKHLSDNCIKRRKAVRERLMTKDREREEIETKKQLVEAQKLEKERFDYFHYFSQHYFSFQRSLSLPEVGREIIRVYASNLGRKKLIIEKK